MKRFQYNKSYTLLADDDAKRLVGIIKNADEKMGILIMRNLYDSFYKKLNGRRVFTKAQRPVYTWDIKKHFI